MAFINLLKNGYRGKLGETVGQKWKNELTLRTYQGTNNSKSEAQLQQRAKYKELITMSSKLYGYAQGFPKNASREMNGFNLFTRTMETLLKTAPRDIFYTPVSVFSKTGIIGPAVQYGTVSCGFFLYESGLINMNNYKKVRLVAIPLPTDDKPQIHLGEFAVAGVITPIIIEAAWGSIRPGKAYYVEPYFTYYGTVKSIYAVGLPVSGKYVYTQFVSINDAPMQGEYSYTYDGEPAEIYFTN